MQELFYLKVVLQEANIKNRMSVPTPILPPLPSNQAYRFLSMEMDNNGIITPYDGNDGICVTCDTNDVDSTQLTCGGIDFAPGKITTGMSNGNIHNHIVFGSGAFLKGFTDSTTGNGKIIVYLSYIIREK